LLDIIILCLIIYLDYFWCIKYQYIYIYIKIGKGKGKGNRKRKRKRKRKGISSASLAGGDSVQPSAVVRAGGPLSLPAG
jgi:hypothetical protein